MSWKVSITKKATKKASKLPVRAKQALRLLWQDLEDYGPQQVSWPNFGKLKGSKNEWHCHLSKGRPRYVVCWRCVSLNTKGVHNVKGEIEIYYAWTHEDAPYS